MAEQNKNIYGRFRAGFTRSMADDIARLDTDIVRMAIAELRVMSDSLLVPGRQEIHRLIEEIERQVTNVEDVAGNMDDDGRLCTWEPHWSDWSGAKQVYTMPQWMTKQISSWQVHGFFQDQEKGEDSSEVSRLPFWMEAVRRALSPWLYPYTVVVECSNDDMMAAMNPKLQDKLMEFADRILDALPKVSELSFGRWFIVRSDLMSGKHEDPPAHIVDRRQGKMGVARAIVAITDAHVMNGLPIPRSFAIRQMLPSDAEFTAFGGLPVARERRVVIFQDDDGNFKGAINGFYWPINAVSKTAVKNNVRLGPEDINFAMWKLAYISQDDAHRMVELSRAVVAAMDGRPRSWSVDWMLVPGQGWVLIDMADAMSSWMPIQDIVNGLSYNQPSPFFYESA